MKITNRISIKCGKGLGILVLLASLAILVPTVPSLSAPVRIQPILTQMSAEQPEATISIIVQKSVKDNSAEETVAQLGGKVTTDLSIINAFAAEMKAKDVPQLAQADGIKWVSLDSPVQSSVANYVFTTWAAGVGSLVPNGFSNAASIVDSNLGANGTYGSGSQVKGSFNGFSPQVTPLTAITKVEVALRLYTSATLVGGDDPHVMIYVGGKKVKDYGINHSLFAPFAGAANAGTLHVDVTSGYTWHWSDFDSGVEVMIDQTMFKSGNVISYDAVGLRVTSALGLDKVGDTGGDPSALAAIDPSKQTNVYNQVVRSSNLWNTPALIQGKGVTVAVIDSGVFKTNDLGKRVRSNINLNDAYHNGDDAYGHGTFVAGIIAGNGSQSGGKYIGVAPRADVLNLRVSDDQGVSRESNVIAGLAWVLINKTRFNIRVVNLSLNTRVAQSYNTSPMDSACEVLWFNGIVVVVSAGNNGTGTLFPPANDPFVITVGATDDKGTLSMSDDIVTAFSAYGTTGNGSAKPDLVAPGKGIIGLLPENNKLTMGAAHPANRIDKTYFRMSGTSVSAPIVAGAVALLLQDEPTLKPDQVKYRLKATANKNWAGYNATKAGAGYLDIYAAVYGTTTASANTGFVVSNLLRTGPRGITASTVSWDSVSWDSVSWDSVSWDSVSWDSVSWDSDYWGP